MDKPINTVYKYDKNDFPYFQYLKLEDHLGALDFRYYSLVNYGSISEYYTKKAIKETIEFYEPKAKSLRQIILN